MRIYEEHLKAHESISSLFLPKLCYRDGDRTCGAWCSHFHLIKSGDSIRAVKLTCSAQECIIKIEEQ